MTPASRKWALFASMCVIWGIPYLLIRVAARDLDPALLVCARTAIGALLLVPLAACRHELRPVLEHWRPLLVFAAIEIAIPWLLLSTAERRLPSSFSGLMIAAVPIVGVGITRERLGRSSLIGLLLGIVGVAALVGLDTGSISVIGVVELLGVVLCYAAGTVVLARRLRGLPSLGVIAWSLAATAIAYLPFALLSLPASMPPAKALGSVIALAVICTALGFVLFFALIAEVGPVRATVITYVNPAVAAALGVTLLGERFTIGMGVGFTLILVGSVLAARLPESPEPNACNRKQEAMAFPLSRPTARPWDWSAMLRMPRASRTRCLLLARDLRFHQSRAFGGTGSPAGGLHSR